MQLRGTRPSMLVTLRQARTNPVDRRPRPLMRLKLKDGDIIWIDTSCGHFDGDYLVIDSCRASDALTSATAQGRTVDNNLDGLGPRPLHVTGIAAVLLAAISACTALNNYTDSSYLELDRVPTVVMLRCQEAIMLKAALPQSDGLPWKGIRSKVDGDRYYVWQDLPISNDFAQHSGKRATCVFPPGRATEQPSVSIM